MEKGYPDPRGENNVIMEGQKLEKCTYKPNNYGSYHTKEKQQMDSP